MQMTTAQVSHSASSLKAVAGRTVPSHHASSASIPALVTELQDRGVTSIILDWDGCVMPLRGDLHGALALKALDHSPLWRSLSVPVTIADAKAAYEGNEGPLVSMFHRLGGQGNPTLARHGAPWDQLMATNLVRLPLTAMDIDAEVQKQIITDLLPNLELILSSPLSLIGCATSTEDLTANPGTVPFLNECAHRGLAIHVVTMTPTSLVEHFARALGLHSLIATFQGCEQFPRDAFPHGKHDESLWISAIQRKGLNVRECAIIEDSRANIRAAVAAGAAAVVSLSQHGNQGFELLCGSMFSCLLSGHWAAIREPPRHVQLLDPGFDYGSFPSNTAFLHWSPAPDYRDR